MKTFLNENIRKLRQLNGYNQVEFASRLNVSKQCVSNWENDNVLPSIEMLVKIADLFQVSCDYLLGRNGDLTIDGEGLTAEQFAHVGMLVADLKKANLKS